MFARAWFLQSERVTPTTTKLSPTSISCHGYLNCPPPLVGGGIGTPLSILSTMLLTPLTLRKAQEPRGVLGSIPPPQYARRRVVCWS